MRLYYGGNVVHQGQSDEGVIEVVDLGDERSLHFGTYPRQSTMSLAKPYSLKLTYTQAMMACLVLNPSPRRALVIGLGGGSLTKFLLHHFPNCAVDVIEFRQDVIDVAHKYFQLPRDEPRLKVYKGDGYEELQSIYFAGDREYDLVLADAYDHLGMVDSVKGQAFFDACAGVLSESGVLSVNLWGSDRALFNQSMGRINRSFNNQTMILPVENKGNVIGLASKRALTTSYLKKLRPTVMQMELNLSINLPKSLDDLIRQNRSFISRLFT
jgi:spermidine synthase